MNKKIKTLEDSQKIVKFYQAARVFYNDHVNQLSEDYEVEMKRRPKEHQMDFEEYCLVVFHLMFKQSDDKRIETPLFIKESYDLMVYYQHNYVYLKKSWDRSIDNNLFEWVLTSYDRFKADSITLSISTLNN
jgi:hypothetical protein